MCVKCHLKYSFPKKRSTDVSFRFSGNKNLFGGASTGGGSSLFGGGMTSQSQPKPSSLFGGGQHARFVSLPKVFYQGR